MRNVCILGATGSIGQSTLSILAQHSAEYRVFALSAYSRLTELAVLCVTYQPRIVVVPEGQADYFISLLAASTLPIASYPEVLAGHDGLCAIAAHADVEIVMAAIVGAAGLLPTLAAVNAGKRVLLANKEALVMAGDVFMQAVKKSGAVLLPIDSEHNAIFQCLPMSIGTNTTTIQQADIGVLQLLLTASGGPFRTWTTEQIRAATPAQACKHPNWLMGQKISVDSATLMNKGLELIEACHLFGVTEDKITVVVHPESIVHSMVQYTDGSTLAQLGNPDMCTPIAHALAYPARISTHVAPLDLIALGQLNFVAPDTDKFPCLQYARDAMRRGGTAPAMLNAANEVAVEAFLQGVIGFGDIARLIAGVMLLAEPVDAVDLATILAADQTARTLANAWLVQHQSDTLLSKAQRPATPTLAVMT